MAVNVDIITREGKGGPLTSSELDLNFTNLKLGIESASPPGFNFAYDATNDFLILDNTVSGGDLDQVQLFPSLHSSLMTLGSPLSQIQANGSFVINKRWPGQGWTEGGGPSHDIFILKADNQEVFKVRDDGVFIFKKQEVPPNNVPTDTGGLYFDGTDFWTQEGV